jgi:hypothetical protein
VSILIAFLLGIVLYSNAQIDSLAVSNTQKKSFFKKVILPTSLIISGALITEKALEISFQNDIRKGVGKGFSTSLDDYFRYAPMVELAIANTIGLKSKNHWFDQAKNLFIINATSFVIVRSLKSMVKRPRPNNQYIYNSFPSGHTTLAFSNATLLYYEYIDYHPFFAYSGYAFATATGAIRVLNDRHWVGDVLVGAGIGMLITHLVYHFEPLKNWNPFLKSKQLSIVPIINSEEFKLSVNWRF